MADINNINSLQDLRDVIDDYVKTPKSPPLSGDQMNIILSKVIEFAPGTLSIDENTPVAVDEAAAVILGLPDYAQYITPTGEIRYKLPTGVAPDAPTDGEVDDENDTFTFMGGEE